MTTLVMATASELKKVCPQIFENNNETFQILIHCLDGDLRRIEQLHGAVTQLMGSLRVVKDELFQKGTDLANENGKNLIGKLVLKCAAQPSPLDAIMQSAVCSTSSVR